MFSGQLNQLYNKLCYSVLKKKKRIGFTVYDKNVPIL